MWLEDQDMMLVLRQIQNIMGHSNRANLKRLQVFERFVRKLDKVAPLILDYTRAIYSRLQNPSYRFK